MTTIETLLLIIAGCQIVDIAIGIVQMRTALKTTAMADSVASAGKQVALRDETIQYLNKEYRELCIKYQVLAAENEKLKAKKDETD